MTTMQFARATRKKTKLRMAIDGPAGSGKTFTALRFAFALGQRVAVIDTEAGSAAKYEGESPDGTPWAFDVLTLSEFSPVTYVNAIAAAIGRYDVLVIDSLSHAWAGKGGALEQVDQRSTGGSSSFTKGWREVSPMHNQLVEAILHCPLHVIATMRSTMDYVIETDGRGKQVPKKVGLAPVQRKGMEYEFDVLASMDAEHNVTIGKSRCSAMDAKFGSKPGPEFIGPLVYWLNEGADVPQEIIDAAGFLERIKIAESNGHAEPAKKLSPEELMAMAAANAGASTTTAATPAADSVAAEAKVAAATPPATGQQQQPPADPPCTADQAKEVHRLLDVLKVPEADRVKLLTSRKVNAIRSLSEAQAAEIIAKLAAKVAPANAVANGVYATQAEAEFSMSLPVEGRTTRCSDEQVKAIVKMLPSLGREAIDKVGAKVRSLGDGKKFSDLSQNDASMLIHCMERNDLSAFLARSLDAETPF